MTGPLSRRAVALGLPAISCALLRAPSAAAQSPPPPAGSRACGARAFSQPSTAESVFIYGVSKGGDLIWHRHDGAERGDGEDVPGAWSKENAVGEGWQSNQALFGGGGGTIYLIDPQGNLKWYRHNLFKEGCHYNVPNAWAPNGMATVGVGWGGLAHVFSPGGGIIYTIMGDGTLRWYKHRAFETGKGLETPGSWEGPQVVNRGWQDLKHVFAGGDGVIYAIGRDGTLHWAKHNAVATGAGLESPGAWEESRAIAQGWGDAKHVFSPGRGLIYAVAPDGTLEWFRHKGFQSGTKADEPDAWLGPKDVSRDWGGFLSVFALMPPIG